MPRTKKENLEESKEVKEKKEVKKTTRKKVTTKKVKPVEEVVEVENNIVEEKPKKSGRIMRNRKNSKSIDIDTTRKVPVVSVSHCPVGYKCKLNNVFLIWEEYGDEHMMTIEEINMMDKMFLNEPWLIVDDEEFMEAYGYSDLYGLIFELEDIEEFYKQSNSIIENKISKLPNGLRRSFLNRTVLALTTGQINNLDVVRFLKDKYNIDIKI